MLQKQVIEGVLKNEKLLGLEISNKEDTGRSPAPVRRHGFVLQVSSVRQ